MSKYTLKELGMIDKTFGGVGICPLGHKIYARDWEEGKRFPYFCRGCSAQYRAVVSHQGREIYFEREEESPTTG